ncbi:anhydro-N-acetylmuramic acid kinase [Alkalilimnicola sp. S0819]|uniref:anhydro-N-acetylmuramic acid kinase n=1 Tax=Alkalilimnicola sp. S0819 TaxID=2613922 RepID=UPI001262A1CB|nr:anhydro-N-acetylmuramic acid kinase [Alkalilimnicola sp. S0819]KAB7623043.1 anhydro-N-acetylmuramic acid kinase [Alkalilimnicola sp. S0819]MPQ17156.1 anhydro-N-acetylmuramic acid kinase [Alkalilimnicola sp. S0819]
MNEYYIGLISGTSRDAVDAALVEFAGARCRTIAGHTHSIPEALRQRLLALSADTPLLEAARLDHALGELFAEACLALLAKADLAPAAIRAIGSHGQTFWHQPDEGLTVQGADPNLIAELTGIPVVADMRRRDMAAGGEGAPLVPIFHAAVLGHPKESRTILNLGGIANITVLPAGAQAPRLGFDTGPASTLLDAWISRHRGLPFDDRGQWGASGDCLPELLGELLADPYFQLPAPKSTGPEHFSLAWLEARLPPSWKAADVQATLLRLTAVSIARAVCQHAPDSRRLLVCGGGVHNLALMEAIAEELPEQAVEPVSVTGLDPDLVEACAFAWLARAHLRGAAGNLPQVTGARGPRVLGGLYPGHPKN